MEILGVGPAELLFVVAIAIIVLGPKNMAETGRTIGSWLNRIVKSDLWKVLKNTSQEIQHLPTEWMREDNLLKHPPTSQTVEEQHDAWSKLKRPSVSPPANSRPVDADPNTIQPTIATPAEPPSASPAPAPVSKKTSKKVSASKKPAPAKKSGKKPAAKASRSSKKKSNA